MVYKLSAPLLYSFEAINKYAEYNKKYEKAQIKLLFNAIPWPQSENFNEWFTLNRNNVQNPDISTYEDFDRYVQYAFSKGFDFVYLMNSPKAFNFKDFDPIADEFYALLDNLWKSGIRKIKFSNTQVAHLVSLYNPKFELSVGTLMEYSSISQFRALLSLFPAINHICLPKDLNQNFHMLQALKENFPNIEFELMVGEGCNKWCPTRLACQSSSSTEFFNLGCNLCIKEKTAYNKIRNGAIHPWQLDAYSKRGFNHFKLLTYGPRAIDTNTENIELYLDCIEHGTNGEHGRKYLSIYCGNLAYELSPEECIKLLPDINYFIENGYKCAFDCGTKCTYCNKLERGIYDGFN